MAINGFDYQLFVENLSSQAKDIFPTAINDVQKQYIINTIKKFMIFYGEIICNDDQANFNAEQRMLIIQIIGEWSFHKTIDIIKAGINLDYYDLILQKINATIFNTAKQGILQGLPQITLLQTIEDYTNKIYKEVLNELKDNKAIDNTVLNNALNQSNIDDLMQQYKRGDICQ